MLLNVDAMLQSLYMLNNTHVSDARRTLVRTEMNGNPDVNPEGRDTTTMSQDANGLDFEVTVKSHKGCSSTFWCDKAKRGAGVVLSPTVETTGGVPKYSYHISPDKLIQTYFKNRGSTSTPFNLRVFYMEIKEGDEVESDGTTIPIKNEETETLFPVQITKASDHIEGWNIYKDNRLILQIRFYS